MSDHHPGTSEQQDRDSSPSDSAPSATPPGHLQRVERSFEASVSFSGPLPPPAALKAYGDISPDYPERIMAMAEKPTMTSCAVTTLASSVPAQRWTAGSCSGPCRQWP